MENHSNPSPIKEYYIAYFDILGYREFFNELVNNNEQGKAEALLSDIHEAIYNTIHRLSDISGHILLNTVKNADLDFKIKIFSDNFLICLDRHNDIEIEKSRALMLLEIIAEIQRYFIISHNLFVRGGITIGSVSFNDDYIFGQGLIDAVELEEKTVYPRIAIDDKYINFITTPILYSPEEVEKAKKINSKRDEREEVSPEEEDFYSQFLSRFIPETYLMNTFRNMVYLSEDGVKCVSYLYKINPYDYFDQKSVTDIIEYTKQLCPEVGGELDKSMHNFPSDLSQMLKNHKMLVENQIKKYGNYNDIEVGDFEKARVREHILKKYAWAMKYHNVMCGRYKKSEYVINSIANCDARFMTLMINIFEFPLPTGSQTPDEKDEASNNEQKQ